MLETIPSAVWTIGGLVLGYAVKAIEDAIQHKRTLAREVSGRIAARRDKISERRVDFQRKTLLELQDAYIQYVRGVAQIHRHDLTHYNAHGEWGVARVPEELDETTRQQAARCALLSSRVDDPNVRSLADDFRDGCSRVVFSKDPDASIAALAEVSAKYERLVKETGQALRQLDAIEDGASITS